MRVGARAGAEGDFAIVGMNVVSMTAEVVQPQRTVVVKDGRIVAIEAAGARRARRARRARPVRRVRPAASRRACDA